MRIVLHGKGRGDGRISVYDTATASILDQSWNAPVLRGEWHRPSRSGDRWRAWLILEWEYDDWLSRAGSSQTWVDPQPTRQALRMAVEDLALRMVEVTPISEIPQC